MKKKVEKKYKMDIREAARFIAQTDCSLDEFAEKNNALSADEAKGPVLCGGSTAEGAFFLSFRW